MSELRELQELRRVRMPGLSLRGMIIFGVVAILIGIVLVLLGRDRRWKAVDDDDGQ